jgi:hypothetical protein
MRSAELVSLRHIAAVGVIGVLLAACSSGSGGGDVFLQGRETVVVDEMGVPDDFDKDQFLVTLATAFGVEGRVQLASKNALGNAFFDNLLANNGRVEVDSVSLDFQTWFWSYYRAGALKDEFCELCSPVTISEVDAVARAKEVSGATGLDPEQLAISVGTTVFDSGTKFAGELQALDVRARRKIDGVVSDQSFRVTFGDGDKIHVVWGYAGVPLKLGEVGLLTPREALAQKYTKKWDGVLDPAVLERLPSDLDKLVLSFASDFNRQELFEYVIPSYNIPLAGVADVLPIGPESGIVENVWAIRYEDLPKIP